MKKVLVIIVIVIMSPFLLLVPIIGAASSVAGFFDPDSGEDFDVENFKSSAVVRDVKSWYEEYLSECEQKLSDRKKELEKENTTIETVEKPGQEPEQEKEEITDSPNPSGNKGGKLPLHPKNPNDDMTVYEPAEPSIKPDDEASDTDKESESEAENREPETIQIEVCHVNVITGMEAFPLGAVLAYYNVLFTKRQSDNLITPTKKDIKAMLAEMTKYSEEKDDNGNNYYINMHFKSYRELPVEVISKWDIFDAEYQEYVESYLNMTQLISGWLDEDLSVFDEAENTDEGEAADG